MGSSDSSLARRLGLATLVGQLRQPSAPYEVSHVQRFPFATCRPCYPGDARRCVHRAPSRRVLRSPIIERLRHHVRYEATSGFTARSAHRFRHHGAPPHG